MKGVNIVELRCIQAKKGRRKLVLPAWEPVALLMGILGILPRSLYGKYSHK
jgi:hypothetical protein